jgi:hypothetical protein
VQVRTNEQARPARLLAIAAGFVLGAMYLGRLDELRAGQRVGSNGQSLRVDRVPHSCPKRPGTGPWNHAGLEIPTGREASNHQGLRVFGGDRWKPVAPPYKQEVACSSHAPPTDESPA